MKNFGTMKIIWNWIERWILINIYIYFIDYNYIIIKFNIY